MSLIDLATLSPATFPTAEDDTFEFKSSRTTSDSLATKLEKAASAFANTGGGCFIWGVDGDGNADGGVESAVGREPVLDWVDTQLRKVEPQIQYERRYCDDSEGRGSLEAAKGVVAVFFPPSFTSPHMASDKKYYIRAGAHTVAAGHFIVEALWARRQVSKPILSHVTRFSPLHDAHIQLGVVALADAPAFDVSIQIEFGDLQSDSIADSLRKRLPLKSTSH